MADDRPEIREPLTSEALTNIAFRTSLRGYDVNQVRAFLRTVDEHLRVLREHNEDLQRRLRDAEERAANPVLDDAKIAAILGDETSRIVQSANEAAAEIRSHAEEHVDRVVQQARDESGRLTAEASNILEVRRAAAEAEAAEILRTASAEAARLTADASAVAHSTLAEAEAAAAEAVEGAKTERNEVLSDVRRRRRLANMQVEQLRAGRERLLQAYEVVRSTLEEVTSELDIAEDEAKAAADAVGRRMTAAIDPNQADSLASAPLLDAPSPSPPKIESPKPEPISAVSETPPGRPHRKGKKGARPPAPVVAVAPEPVVEVVPEPVVEVVPEPVVEVVAEAAAPDTATTDMFDRMRAAREEKPVKEKPKQQKAPDVAKERATARNVAVEELQDHVTRRLKRQLQDEQNVVLDRMRSKRGAIDANAAVGDEAAHLATYAAIVLPSLANAARAGAKAAGGAEVADDVVAVTANDFAMELVLPIRRRLDERLHEAAVGGDDRIETSDRLSAAYREAKTQRVARLTGDWLVAAWSVGVHTVTPAGAPGSWAADPANPCCSDCDDNNLAGAVPAGTAFPTGHLHPPAHPGCRCVVVPPSS